MLAIDKMIGNLTTLSKTVSTAIEAKSQLNNANINAMLADALVTLSQLKIEMMEMEETLRSLKNQLSFQSNIRFIDRAYYQVNEQDEVFGPAFCSHCWDASKKAIHILKQGHNPTCPSCNTLYIGIQLTR